VQTRFFKERAGLLLIAGLAIAVVVVRAIRQSVSIDEAGSFLLFVRTPWPNPLFPSSGNHVLNSLLQKLVNSVFGFSEFAMRAPAVAGAVVYVISALWLCLMITRRTLVQFALFVCLVYNPMILDYLVAARGYSLACGFLLAALALIASAILSADRSDSSGVRGKCILVSILLALSFCSNFSFAFVDGTAALLFFLWAAMQSRKADAKWYLRLAARCFLPGIVVASVICGKTLWGYPRSQLYFGSESLTQMWNGLVSSSFDDANSEIPWVGGFLALIRPSLTWVAIGTTMLLLIAAETDRSGDSPARRLRTLIRFLLCVACVTLAVHWTAFRVLHILLPKDRTGLFFVMLGTLVFGGATSILLRTGRSGGARWIGSVVLIAVAMFFVGCLRFSYFREWKFNADTKALYETATDIRKRCGVTDLETDWRYSPAFDVYREVDSDKSIPEFSGSASASPTPGHQAYVIDYPRNEQFVKDQRLTVMYRNEVSGAALAVSGAAIDIRGCSPQGVTLVHPAR
jgi:hypothetical protein